MTSINSFRDPIVWQASVDLASLCFDLVEATPYPYRFTFSNQLIPAGLSVPSNIAEGSRRPTKAYLSHLSYSLGSHAEIETILELIRRRKLVREELLAGSLKLTEAVGKMLHGLAESLEVRLQNERTRL